MTMQGWLWLDDCEILNDARFFANLEEVATLTGCGPDPSIQMGVAPPDTLALDPCDRLHPTLLEFGDHSQDPWHDSRHMEESTSFLGYLVTACTFDSTFSRSIDQRASLQPGANFSGLRRPHREIAFTVLMAAQHDFGLQWGFDWLSQKIAGCDPFGLSTAMVRLSAAQPFDPWQDLWMLEGVGLTDPLKWADRPMDPVRRDTRLWFGSATFVISASDPDRRTCPNVLVEPSQFLDADNIPDLCMDGKQWLCGPFPDFRIQAEMPPPGQIGTHDAIITIQAGPFGTPPVHVYGAPNPLDLACADPRLDLCLDMRIANLAPDEKVIVDSSRERVWVSSPKTSFKPIDGIRYVVPPKSGVPNFIQLSGCTKAWLWVEPENACGLTPDITVAIEYVHRVPT